MARQAEQDSNRGSARNAAMLLKVAQTMSKLAIAPLPRNYELFYEALFGQHPGLFRDLTALGAQPAQADLDAIGTRCNLVGHSALSADKARADAAGVMAELLGKLDGNHQKRQSFTASLQAFIDRIETDPVAAMSDFAQEASRFVYAAQTHVREEQAFARSIDGLAAQLRDAAGDFETSRKALTRDAVTGLPNRVAFTNRLTALFDPQGEQVPNALILVTIDGLQSLGETHGGGPVEKVLKKLAPVFRKIIKKNDFVARVANDEFAFIFENVSAENAVAIAGRIRDSVEAIQIALPDRSFTRKFLSISAGIAMSPEASGAPDLCQQADLALKTVKANGGGAQMLFSAAIGSMAGRRRSGFVA